jgi:anti-sigma regulatory factor (Ser/Thr protein kinase)
MTSAARARDSELASAIDQLDPPSQKFVWSAALSLFTITGFFRLTYKYFDDVAHRESGTFLARLIDEATGTYAAAALFVAIVAIVWRFPLDRPGWRQRIPVHVAVMVAYSITHTTMLYVSRSIISRALGAGPYDYGYLPARYLMEFGNDAVSYLYFLALITLYRYYRTTRQRELRTAQLERGLAQAELRNLRLQLQPHFLFNALNTISSTMYEDPRSADRMVGQLSQLLRLSLRTSQEQEVPLRYELEVLECYLGLMRARFGKRLTTTVVTEPETLDARVPSLLLQPLVENAIRHGNASHASGGAIEVNVKRVGSMLDIDIADDGPGVPNGTDVYGRGVGLSSTRDRLRLLYGTAHRFEAGNRNGGFAVSIALPFSR